MAAHSSIHAWRIPWIEDPGGVQSMASQRVGNDSVTNTQFSFVCVCKQACLQVCLTLCSPVHRGYPTKNLIQMTHEQMSHLFHLFVE